MGAVRILVADQHSLFRDGLVSLLEASGFRVVSQVGDGAAAVEAALACRPDVILLDTLMPEINGLNALRRIREQWPEATVVILTGAEDDQELVEAVEAGARGYLSKSLRADEFIEMLKGLDRGEAAMTRQAAGRLLSAFSRLAHRHEPNELTDREVELLRLLAEGRSNKDIAQMLSVSENTVKYHIKNILQKLDVHNRTEAAAHAVRIGLVRTNHNERLG
jgi:DNA-binding NarL/FixJ family response regulator